jgi:aspartyl-tRNA(Asn)/glutamyl-tRNA(Gln) amidotransferase subunit C
LYLLVLYNNVWYFGQGECCGRLAILPFFILRILTKYTLSGLVLGKERGLEGAIMPLERDEVEKIAHLARLTLEESQIDPLARDLSKILDLVNHINEADTKQCLPMAHPMEELTQRLRPDVVSEKNQRDLFLTNAPEAEAGLYLVPKIIETE